MKVAWIVDAPLDRKTGGTIYDAIIVEGMRARGVEIEVHFVSLGNAQRLIRDLVRARPDVIVGDELCFAALDIVFEHASFARRVLLVHHLTCWELELAAGPRARARRLEARVLRKADRIVATSTTTRKRLIAEGAQARIDVIRPGADRLPRHVRRATNDVIELIFVGAIVPRKRVIELVHAFASASSSAHLTIVGSRERDERYVARVDDLVRGLGLSRRVTCVGEIDETKLADRLAQAHALVLPSSLEGYGIAATEALHAGVPVLAARTDGLVEALASTGDAVIFVANQLELARSIAEVTQDQPRRARLIEAASRAGAALPSWSASIEEFQRVLMD